MIFHGSDIFFCLEYIRGMNQGVSIKKEGIFEDPQVLLRIAYRSLHFEKFYFLSDTRINLNCGLYLSWISEQQRKGRVE